MTGIVPASTGVLPYWNPPVLALPESPVQWTLPGNKAVIPSEFQIKLHFLSPGESKPATSGRN